MSPVWGEWWRSRPPSAAPGAAGGVGGAGRGGGREREQARDFLSGATVGEADFKRAVAAFGYEAAVLLDEDGRLLRVAPVAP